MTHKKEPLGHSYTRDYVWPSSVKDSNSFGVGSNQCESAKDLLFPNSGARDENPDYARMYEKTHANYAAGAQKSRQYNWKIDPTQHAFGYGEKSQPNQAARAIHSERVEESYPKTVVVKKSVEDVKAVQYDHLGHVKNMG